MNVSAECIPCFLNASLKAMTNGGWPEERRAETLLSLLPLLSRVDIKKTPAENVSKILHRLVQTMGGDDPFKAAKAESNRRALELLPELRQMLSRSPDPLELVVKIAIAGNIVDLGIFDEYDLSGAVQEALKTGFAAGDYPEFRKLMGRGGKVLIIGDNSGEVVFDRLLVEVLVSEGAEVIYGVKGGFVLNDATLDDATEAGINNLCQVVANGNNFIGTVPEKCTEEFLQVFNAADLVISKGQANYYTLEGSGLAGNKTFFLLKAKCDVIAKSLGMQKGDLVFRKNKVS